MPQLPQSDPIELQTRLQDEAELFTRNEVYQSVAMLAPEMGFNRDERLPKPGTVRLFTLTVTGFEHLGALQVKLLSYEARLEAANMRSMRLGVNINPDASLVGYTELIARAQLFVVSPPDLIAEMLQSTAPDVDEFFLSLAAEYQALVEDHTQALRQKKPLATDKPKNKSGKESASTSDTAETSSPQTPDG